MFEKMKFILSELWSFLQPLIRHLLSDAGTILAQAAMAAVTAVAAEMSGASNEEKRQAAFEKILDDLKTSGIQLGASVINAALEAAVVKMKAQQE